MACWSLVCSWVLPVLFYSLCWFAFVVLSEFYRFVLCVFVRVFCRFLLIILWLFCRDSARLFGLCSVEILQVFVLVLPIFVQVLFVGFAAHSSRLCLVLQ